MFAQHRNAAFVEPLESRRLLSTTIGTLTFVKIADGITLPGGGTITPSLTARGTLVLKGDGEANIIAVRKSGATYQISTGGDEHVFSFDAANVKRILIEGQGGNDRL